MPFGHKLVHRLALLRDRLRRGALLALALTFVASCEKPISLNEPNPTVAQLVVSPTAVTLQPNQVQDFMAVGFTAAGDTADITVTWSATAGTVDTNSSGGRHYGHYKNGSCGSFKVVATSHPGDKSDTASVTVTCPPVSASLSTVAAAPTAITAGGGGATITVTVKDANGNPVGGATVVLTATGSGNTLTQPTGPTTASGMVTGTLSSTVAGSKTVSATASGTAITQTVSVTVNPGSVSASQSTVTASPTSIVVGSGTSTITVTAKDANGNPISGATVVLSATGSGNTLTQPGGPTNTSGVATGTLSSSVAEAKTVSATANGITITQTTAVTVVTPPPPGTTVVLVGAGDIAGCSTNGDEATAALLDGIPGTVFTAGDNAYADGSDANYSQCYDPTWGRHKARTRPSTGNHDYHQTNALGYWRYFGSAGGDSAKYYYSYDLGDWHIIALNSNISMSAGSPQETWLRADLAASTKTCTIAYWHHPRFSSGTQHGSLSSAQPLWQALYDNGAEIVISGHEHNYERFAPQTPTGMADPTRGIREFVVGTGGESHYNDEGTPLPNSEVFNGTTYGVLKLTLSAGSYTWEFVPVAGGAFTDSGSGTCH